MKVTISADTSAIPTGPSTYARAILLGLQKKRFGEVYMGTVSPGEKAARRKRGKAAKIARRASR